MIVPAGSPSPSKLVAEYSNKGGNCSQTEPPPGMWGPPLPVHYPSQSFLFCFRFILPVMSCPNEMLIFTEITFFC